MIFFNDFVRKILNPFSAVEHYSCHILGIVGPIVSREWEVRLSWNERDWSR